MDSEKYPPVVGPDRGDGALLKRVCDADSVRLRHQGPEFLARCPTELGDFLVRRKFAGKHAAPEDQGDDTNTHVLVDAG